MAKEGYWTFGIIDDNQKLIIMDRYDFCLDSIHGPSDVYLQFIKAGYNVTDNMILNFKWLDIEWDYVQLIEDEGWIDGLRLFKRSPYLNAYHITSNCVKKDSLLENYFHCKETHCNYPVKYYFKFDVHYGYDGGQYNIVVDIVKFYEELYSNYTLYSQDGKLYVKYQRKN